MNSEAQFTDSEGALWGLRGGDTTQCDPATIQAFGVFENRLCSDVQIEASGGREA